MSAYDKAVEAKLTPAQRDLLADFGDAQYGELCLGKHYLRTVEGLFAAGLVERTTSMRWFKISESGRALLSPGSKP